MLVRRLCLFALLLQLGWDALPATAEPLASRPFTADPFTREVFDRLDRSINDGNGFKSGAANEIAWGECYIMLAYLDMYRVTGDTYYLDKLVDHADHVLKRRDDVRGFKDYSGRSRAAWSVAGGYTVAELTLRDAAGREVLRFRSVPYAFNDKSRIRVTTQPSGDRFNLIIENPKWPPREEYTGLSMDRGSPDFVERRVNACKSLAPERKLACTDDGSKLVAVQALGGAEGPPAADPDSKPLDGRDINMVPLFMAYHGYSGQATYPMLDFAWMVRQDPKLGARYGSYAERYIAEAVKVFLDADEEWRTGPGPDEGHYVNGRRGCPFWSDNVGKAHNYQASLGRSLLRLGQLTGDRRWTDHAERVARLLKNRLRTADNGSYVWNYWWGLGEQGWTMENSPSFNTPVWKGFPRAEDSSHGHLEIDFACLCARSGLVFDEADMGRFARTFLLNVVNEKKRTTNDHVDGKGGWGNHVAVVGGWMELAAWEPQVAQAGLQVARAQKLHEGKTGVSVWTLARMIKWSRR
jgi:hypothetical protein